MGGVEVALSIEDEEGREKQRNALAPRSGGRVRCCNVRTESLRKVEG